MTDIAMVVVAGSLSVFLLTISVCAVKVAFFDYVVEDDTEEDAS